MQVCEFAEKRRGSDRLICTGYQKSFSPLSQQLENLIHTSLKQCISPIVQAGKRARRGNLTHHPYLNTPQYSYTIYSTGESFLDVSGCEELGYGLGESLSLLLDRKLALWQMGVTIFLPLQQDGPDLGDRCMYGVE